MLQTMVKIIIITVIIQLARGVSSEREGGGKRGRGVHTVDRAAAMCVCGGRGSGIVARQLLVVSTSRAF